mmetsp:Transcript_2046/g.1874  ORF Transcript_2046/g.1874 Transcript_2046/m.1874 type:complete len:233 (+) Transcript_2046:96-794(+)
MRKNSEDEIRKASGEISIDEDLNSSTDEHNDEIKTREYRAKSLRDLVIQVDKKHYEKWIVYYCTNIGHIEGQLTVSQMALHFEPSKLTKNMSPTKKQKSPSKRDKEQGILFENKIEHERFKDFELIDQKLRRFETCIDIEDIHECNVITVPSLLTEEHFEINHEFEKDYLLQIILHGHGDRSMGVYLNEKFQEMRQKQESYACLYFKLKNEIGDDPEVEYTNDQKHDMLHDL